MMGYFHGFAMCRSMFCAIPCLWRVWDEKARDKLLLFLPLVGLEIGGIWVLIWWLCGLLSLPVLVTSLLLCVYPFAVTGGIHLDGFMDVTDAVRSFRELPRRREILKDSHVGSFAVIGVVLLILAQFALFASAGEERSGLILLFIPVVSRCGSALAVTWLPPMETSQYAGQRYSAAQLAALLGMLVCALVLGFWTCGKYGFALLGCIAGHGLALLRAYRSLRGMNGDISGYALTIGELCGIAVYALL